jgi:hypothetical protein
MSVVCASNCGRYAKAVLMSESLPSSTACGVAVLRHAIHPEEWAAWTAKLKADLGFMAEFHLQSPCVWSSVSGRYLGGCEALQLFARTK